MAYRIIIKDRGMIEIENTKIKCYLGKRDNPKSSEEIYHKYKIDIPTKVQEFVNIDNQKYLIIYPIPEKIISIITNEGKKYKSTVYFLDDIKNIISGLKMINPCYFEEDKYNPFQTKDNYLSFLYGEDANEIKDIGKKEIDFSSLRKNYNEFKIKESIRLSDINKNIYLYSKIDNIGKENYLITSERNDLKSNLNEFGINEKRSEINDVIYGILGNYGTGKTIFLIYYNYKNKFPSIYLNLKILKNTMKTKSFSDILNYELMILFYKLKKSYEDYECFIKQFLPYDKYDLKTLIIEIIDKLKSQNIIAIIDQYKEEIFPNDNFIADLKTILFNKGSKIKVIIVSSLNNGKISSSYLDMVFGKIKPDNKKDDYIPYHFIEKLVDDSIIKNYIKNMVEKQYDIKFNSTLKLFNFLPSYYYLCSQDGDNLDKFITTEKQRIKSKISKFNSKRKSDIRYLDEIRKMIDKEINDTNLEPYCQYIPFKYFYIEKTNQKYILRTHFPLIKEIWINIIMKQAENLLDGKIKYDNNVIGSLLELNFITNIKNKKISLYIDSFCKVDTIYEFGNLIEKDTGDFKNKNIFITQNNQNGPNFDLAYFKGKNTKSPKIVYIQVKKSLSNNRIGLLQTKKIFEEKKNNFSKLFGLMPKEFNLVYITLFNDKIKEVFLEHNNYDIGRTNKVSNIDNDFDDVVYSLDLLNVFCEQNFILLYYYEPKTNNFYIKENNMFKMATLELFKKIKITIPLIFDCSNFETDFEKNKEKCKKINVEHKKFLNKKRNKSDKFSYKINKFDCEILFDFTKDYFDNTDIISYIDLHENHLNFRYYNRLSKNQAMICLKITDKNEYKVDSLIYNNHMFKKENEGLILKNNIKLDKDNDFIIFIRFDSILEGLKSLLL